MTVGHRKEKKTKSKLLRDETVEEIKLPYSLIKLFCNKKKPLLVKTIRRKGLS
jgi:hypothetical protein